ncbi:MAG: cytochrome c1 [Pseudomonadota bacterium]
MTILRILSSVVAALTLASAAYAAGGAKHAHPPEGGWPFAGPLGQFEMDSVQRGYQIYKEVCSSCHSMKLLSYRHLGDPGGPFYDADYPNPNENPLVKALAAENEILDPVPNEFGEFDFRPARPSDTFRSPYPNDNAAMAANGGALPPDLSVITKARHGGASYVYALMKSYPGFDEFVYNEAGDAQLIFDDDEKPEYNGRLTQPIGQYYNPYFPGDTTPNFDGDPRHTPEGGFLAMAPQLTEGRVEYLDGTEATIQQMSYDVAQFLAWAGEPKQENRKSLGAAVMIYLVIFAGLLWFSYRSIWRNVGH